MHDDPRSQPPPTLEVAVFAGLAEAVGARRVTLPWPGGRVGDLRTAVAARAPAAAALVSRSAVVVDGRHAADDEAVPSGADVALLPPVSGG
jgi:molybdopterin converting factor small subunit